MLDDGDQVSVLVGPDDPAIGERLLPLRDLRLAHVPAITGHLQRVRVGDAGDPMGGLAIDLAGAAEHGRAQRVVADGPADEARHRRERVEPEERRSHHDARLAGVAHEQEQDPAADQGLRDRGERILVLDGREDHEAEREPGVAQGTTRASRAKARSRCRHRSSSVPRTRPA